MAPRKQGRYEGEHSEGQFSSWCAAQGYFRIKLQIDKSNKSDLGKIIARAMPSDFLVVTPDRIKFVEIKEVWRGDRFVNDRFRQQYKLTKLSRHYPDSNIMEGYLLINFVAFNTVCLMKIAEYNTILEELDKKSITLEQIPDKFKFTWKDLIL